MTDYIGLESDAQIDADSHGRFVRVMKWPIIFILMVTSLPAGFTPFIVAGAYSELGQDQRVSPKWRNQRRIESGRYVFRMALLVAAAAAMAHAFLVSRSWRKWNYPFLTVRGAVWFVLAWSAFALGMVFGVWIYMAATK
jgi:hypothetical protein